MTENLQNFSMAPELVFFEVKDGWIPEGLMESYEYFVNNKARPATMQAVESNPELGNKAKGNFLYMKK